MLSLQSSVSELPKFWAATFCPNPDFLSYERGNCHNSLLWVNSNGMICLFVCFFIGQKNKQTNKLNGIIIGSVHLVQNNNLFLHPLKIPLRFGRF